MLDINRVYNEVKGIVEQKTKDLPTADKSVYGHVNEIKVPDKVNVVSDKAVTKIDEALATFMNNYCGKGTEVNNIV